MIVVAIIIIYTCITLVHLALGHFDSRYSEILKEMKGLGKITNIELFKSSGNIAVCFDNNYLFQLYFDIGAYSPSIPEISYFSVNDRSFFGFKYRFIKALKEKGYYEEINEFVKKQNGIGYVSGLEACKLELIQIYKKLIQMYKWLRNKLNTRKG